MAVATAAEMRGIFIVPEMPGLVVATIATVTMLPGCESLATSAMIIITVASLSIPKT